MKRLLLAMALLAGLTGAGLARTVEERLIAGLRDQGYVILEDGYTFLGRLRIVAENGQYHREIVVNPGTGEVLRDYVVERGDPPQTPGGGGSLDSPGAAVATTATTGTASTSSGIGVAAMATGTGIAGVQGSPSQSNMLLAEPVLSVGQATP